MTPAILAILQVVYDSKWAKDVMQKIIGTVLAVGKRKDATEAEMLALRDKLLAMPGDPTDADIAEALAGYHAASDALDQA